MKNKTSLQKTILWGICAIILFFIVGIIISALVDYSFKTIRNLTIPHINQEAGFDTYYPPNCYLTINNTILNHGIFEFISRVWDVGYYRYGQKILIFRERCDLHRELEGCVCNSGPILIGGDD